MTANSRIEHRLRLADRNDLPRLQEIAAAAFSDIAILNLAELQQDETLFLAEWRMAVDGLIVLLPLQASILVHRMAVAEDARGQGIGGWMLDCAAEHARSLGRKTVEVQRPLQDRRGIDWLRRHGFTPDPHAGNKVYLRRPA